LIIIVTSVIIVFIQPVSPNVSSDIMEKYAQTLVSDYNKNINFFLPSNYSYFPFHSNLAYNATTIISSNYGTALLLYPADKWSFNNTETDQRIEEAVFGADNLNFGTQIFFNGSGIAFESYGNYSEGIHLLIKYIGFTIRANCSIIFRNVNINSVPYFFLILKSNNEASSWSRDAALNDSKLIFDDDLYFALNTSEAIREYHAEPELDQLLMTVLIKWHNQLLANRNETITYTPSQMEYDLEQIEEKAKNEYGITNNDFINRSLNALESVALPPPSPTKTIFNFPINDPSNWIYVGFLLFLIVLSFVVYFILEYFHKKLSYFVAVLTVIIIPIIILIFHDHPYDYQLASSQTALIVAVLLIGLIGVYLERRKITKNAVA
jgi:hypothetical protein